MALTSKCVLSPVPALRGHLALAPAPNLRASSTCTCQAAVALAKPLLRFGSGRDLRGMLEDADVIDLELGRELRRRGIAAALTSTLGRAAFDRGVPVLMLMAHEAEQAVYARAGFTVASEIIFIST